MAKTCLSRSRPAALLMLLALGCAGPSPLASQGAEASAVTASAVTAAGAGAAATAIAYAYLRQAQSLLSQGDASGALRLLQTSLEFRPDSSESAYLMARIYKRSQQTTYLAIRYLEMAIASSAWAGSDPKEARTELAELYVRTGQFARALAGLRAEGDGTLQQGLGGGGSATVAGLWARSLVGLGRPTEAARLLAGALERFPGQAELYVLQARTLSSLGRGREARELLGNGVKALPGAPELLYELAAVEPQAERRLQLLQRYFAGGGSHPGAALLALRSHPPEPLSYLERFLSLGGNGRILYLDELARFLYAQLPAEARSGTAPAAVEPQPGVEVQLWSRLERAIEGYSGTRILDEDRDGFYEEQYEYRDGQLQGWLQDGDQDGRPELTVRFQDGLPKSLQLVRAWETPGVATPPQTVLEIDYLYSGYPYLESVTFLGPQDRREYDLVPYRLQEALFVSPSFAAPPGQQPRPLRLRPRSGLLTDESAIRAVAYRMLQQPAQQGTAGAGPSTRLYDLLDGQVVRLAEEPDPTGRYTHVVLYERSVPVQGRRDLDGDGRYEIREEYANGKLRRVELDQDGDGVIEFLQTFEDGGTRKLWDYNDDGLFDSREYTDAGGTTVREYSSRQDGVFDLRTVIRGGSR
jgi:tetratricopeptide (TPR) repeat protein